MMTFTQRLNTYRPPLCRMLARLPYGRPLTAMEIFTRSAFTMADVLTLTEIEAISQSESWDGVTIRAALKFWRGTGVDVAGEKVGGLHAIEVYLRSKPTFRYLRAAPDWKSYWLPLMTKWRRSYGKTLPPDLWPPLRETLTRLNVLLK